MGQSMSEWLKRRIVAVGAVLLNVGLVVGLYRSEREVVEDIWVLRAQVETLREAAQTLEVEEIGQMTEPVEREMGEAADLPHLIVYLLEALERYHLTHDRMEIGLRQTVASGIMSQPVILWLVGLPEDLANYIDHVKGLETQVVVNTIDIRSQEGGYRLSIHLELPVLAG